MLISHLRNTAAAAAVAAGSLAFMAGPAGAQACGYPMNPCPTTTLVATASPDLELSKIVVRRNETITATVFNFLPGSGGLLTIASVEQQVGTFTMPASGPDSVRITIPGNIELGAHTVFARGTALNGQPGSAAEGITVVADQVTGAGSSGTNLARTGAVVIPTVLVGAGLVLGGMAIKRAGEARADQLAETLHVTVSAVRQHLAVLSDDGLVSHRVVRGGPGRPAHLYRLSDLGDGLFPRTYGAIVTELLGELEAEAPELVDKLFEGRRKRRVERA